MFVCMLQLCATSISKRQHIIFNKSIMNEYFPNKQKQTSIIAVHKRDDKKIITNYRPVSRLPICIKISEKLYLDNQPGLGQLIYVRIRSSQ